MTLPTSFKNVLADLQGCKRPRARSSCQDPLRESWTCAAAGGDLTRPWYKNLPRASHCILCASPRSRTAHGHGTKPCLCENLQEKKRGPESVPWSSLGLNSYCKNPWVRTYWLGNWRRPVQRGASKTSYFPLKLCHSHGLAEMQFFVG